MLEISNQLSGWRPSENFWKQTFQKIEQRLANSSTLKTVRLATLAFGVYSVHSLLNAQGFLPGLFSFGTMMTAAATFVFSMEFGKLPFQESLDKWCEEKKDEEKDAFEYYNRLEAAKRIVECYRNRERSLDLSHLALTSVPSEAIEYLSHNLEALNLSDNHISDPQIYSLRNLKKLDLHNNQIKMVFSLHSLPHLEELDLSHNRFAKFPEDFDLDSLRSINLSENQLTCLEPETFHFMSSLKNIDLRNNQITSMPRFWGKRVDLSGNPIQV